MAKITSEDLILLRLKAKIYDYREIVEQRRRDLRIAQHNLLSERAALDSAQGELDTYLDTFSHDLPPTFGAHSCITDPGI